MPCGGAPGRSNGGRLCGLLRVIVMNFGSDNAAGASPKVMEALMAANQGVAAAYGADAWTTRVEAQLSDVFEREIGVSLLATGTAANALALACVTRPWSAVLCHDASHIMDDECGAPEFFTDGAKLVGIGGVGGKLDPGSVASRLARMPHGSVKQVQPACLSISQLTECGLVYSPSEIAALKEAIRPRGLKLHMDGARFANAVASLGCTPAEITWKAGVDVLSFGVTKNGAWAAEAVLFFDPAGGDAMPWRKKRAGHTLSKGRFVAAQFEALLHDGHWLDLARLANARARRLAAGLSAVEGVRLGWACEGNEVFAIMPKALSAGLRAAGAVFYDWAEGALDPANALRAGEGIHRFVCSFATGEAEISALVQQAERLAGMPPMAH